MSSRLSSTAVLPFPLPFGLPDLLHQAPLRRQHLPIPLGIAWWYPRYLPSLREQCLVFFPYGHEDIDRGFGVFDLGYQLDPAWKRARCIELTWVQAAASRKEVAGIARTRRVNGGEENRKQDTEGKIQPRKVIAGLTGSCTPP
jgi:hypothetical protein